MRPILHCEPDRKLSLSRPGVRLIAVRKKSLRKQVCNDLYRAVDRGGQKPSMIVHANVQRP